MVKIEIKRRFIGGETYKNNEWFWIMWFLQVLQTSLIVVILLLIAGVLKVVN